MKTLVLNLFILSFASIYIAGCDNSTSPKLVTQGNGGGYNNPPAAPSNPSPTNNATNTSNVVALQWSCSDPDAGDTVKYDIYLDNVNPPAERVVSNYLPTTYGFGVVDHNLTLFWKVVAHDTKGASTSGPVWRFTTAP